MFRKVGSRGGAPDAQGVWASVADPGISYRGGGAKNGMGLNICKTMKRQNEVLAARERSDQAGWVRKGVLAPSQSKKHLQF